MKEYEIRPQELLEKYIELSVQDAENFQNFLAKNQLSSHVWVIGEK